MIMAGGSGTRLWPMSRRGTPKQLIPFLDGRSLLQMAWERLEGLIPPERVYVCAPEEHRRSIAAALPDLHPGNYIGEPSGRDTLNAVGLSATVIGLHDPDALFAAVTADHIIGPKEAFQQFVAHGFDVCERDPRAMVTFGITPTAPATGFGYLELGERRAAGVYAVRQFREKPGLATARQFYDAGPERFLWNSGMFVWRAGTLLECIRRFEPSTAEGLEAIGRAWDGPERAGTLEQTYGHFRKISVDYALMEPASRDPAFRVVAVPMRIEWMDVGNWSSFAKTCPADPAGNRLSARRAIVQDSRDTLVASSDPAHLIAVIGCEGLMVIHTPDATLVCPADQAEAVKDLTQTINERFGPEAL